MYYNTFKKKKHYMISAYMHIRCANLMHIYSLFRTKMRLEMVIEMEIRIVNDHSLIHVQYLCTIDYIAFVYIGSIYEQSPGLFSKELFKKRFRVLM